MYDTCSSKLNGVYPKLKGKSISEKGHEGKKQKKDLSQDTKRPLKYRLI